MSQAEAEAFYADMAAADAGNPEPVSYGLNSQLTKDDAGRICERVWKLGGMYSPAIERIVYSLERAQAVAKEPQKTNIAALVSYYKTAMRKTFDRYDVGWVAGCSAPFRTSISSTASSRTTAIRWAARLRGRPTSTSWTPRPATARR